MAYLEGFITSLDSTSVAINPILFKLNPTVEKFTVRLTIATSDERVG